MKSVLKTMGALSIGMVAGMAGGMYLMENKRAMQKAGKKVISAMDSVEAKLEKKIN